jgi:hypothetical protein
MKKAFLSKLFITLLACVIAAAIPFQQAGAVSARELDNVTFNRVAAPSNLTATLSFSTGILLKWTDN